MRSLFEKWTTPIPSTDLIVEICTDLCELAHHTGVSFLCIEKQQGSRAKWVHQNRYYLKTFRMILQGTNRVHRYYIHRQRILEKLDAFYDPISITATASGGYMAIHQGEWCNVIINPPSFSLYPFILQEENFPKILAIIDSARRGEVPEGISKPLWGLSHHERISLMASDPTPLFSCKHPEGSIWNPEWNVFRRQSDIGLFSLSNRAPILLGFSHL